MSLTQQQAILNTPSEDPSRIAVENLIASIKSKQLQEAQRQSDRQILDIIHRVLGRTVDLVYDEDEQDRTHQESERQQTMAVADQAKISMILEEEDRAVTPRAPDVSRMDVEIERHSDDDEQDIEERERTIGSVEPPDDDERIDMSRDPLYRHFLLGITNEDLLSVHGTHIDTSRPSTAKSQGTRAKSAKHDEKSVHHFCIQRVDDEDLLPKGIRAISQLYHQRARYRNKLPFSSVYHKHGQLPMYPRKQIIEEEDEEQGQMSGQQGKTYVVLLH